MKLFKLFSGLFFLSVCVSCSPKVMTSVSSSREPLQPDAPIAVIGLSGTVPDEAETLGTVKIGDTGFTTNCSYDAVIVRVKEAARAAGGNAVKITRHRLPSAMGSTCHRIEADILYLPAEFLAGQESAYLPRPDSALLAEGCAMIHFYRFSGSGFLVGYDIHVGDETIARIGNNSKETLKIRALGETTFWARTEARAEVTIPVEAGYHYYIRCGVGMGVMVGRPDLEWVEPRIGQREYESIRERN